MNEEGFGVEVETVVELELLELLVLVSLLVPLLVSSKLAHVRRVTLLE